MKTEFDWKNTIAIPMLRGFALILAMSLYSWVLGIIDLTPLPVLYAYLMVPTVNGVIGLILLLLLVGISAEPILKAVDELLKKLD